MFIKLFKISSKIGYRQHKRYYSVGKSIKNELKTIRNIGIMAHIDAGKTTTTERMLFYSGFIHAMGEVHDGDTVTDYMIQERERGITITSAAITFPWKGHKINLVDTPGHVDFTIEVERSLRVLDGAITVLDASAGVEAQTQTVWKQADRYKVPRIIYLNKMDKPKANYHMCLDSIEKRLKSTAIPLHLPVFSEEGRFNGIIDVVSMEKMIWDFEKSGDGRKFQREKITETHPSYENALESRLNVIEILSELDSGFGEAMLQQENVETMDSAALVQSLRKVTMASLGFPLLCGSSYKNVGVQPLLDAVLAFLPSPEDKTHDFTKLYGENLCALAFKTIHDKQKGALTFLRLYSGSFNQGDRLYNINREVSEKPVKLLAAYADEFKELESSGMGGIILVTGLKETITGDTLTSSSNVVNNILNIKAEGGVDHKINPALLAGVRIPEPVFFCTVEPASLQHQKGLDLALACLLKEDPSLTSEVNENGQIILKGMGELHLDIIKDRIQREYKVEVDMGPLQVSYRELLMKRVEKSFHLDKKLADVNHNVLVKMSLNPVHTDENIISEKLLEKSKKTIVELEYDRENTENLNSIRKDYFKAVVAGIDTALRNGPLLGFPLIGAQVKLRWLEVKPGTSHSMVTSAAFQCVAAALKSSKEVRLMEPFMQLEIGLPGNKVSAVLTDLNRRRAQVSNVEGKEGGDMVIRALAPVEELVGYSTALRTVTSGMTTFSIEFHSYQQMAFEDETRIINKMRGII